MNNPGSISFAGLICGVMVLTMGTSFRLDAQQRQGVGFSLTSHLGGILKHTEKLTFTPPDYSIGIEATATFRTYGRKDWEVWRSYPILGLSVHAFDLGTEQLGQAYGFFPFVDIPLWRKEQFQLFFQLGSGVAWLTRRNDRVHNPLHNAIGSNLNNVSAFRLHADWNVRPQWIITGGVSLTHYSNGQARIPNFGINVVAGMLGLQYTPYPLRAEDYLSERSAKKPLHRWGFSAHTGLAYKEYFAVGGPKYPVYMGSIAGMYQISRINRLYAGLEYEFNQGIAAFSKLSWQHESDRDRFWAASRMMIFVGEEFLFGDWAFLVQAGTYVGGFGDLVPFPVYTRLAMRYYLPPFPGRNTRFFCGAYMKSHIITAEYISFGLGVTLAEP